MKSIKLFTDGKATTTYINVDRIDCVVNNKTNNQVRIYVGGSDCPIFVDSTIEHVMELINAAEKNEE